ncbi:HsdM family class I SAM-dependent methyltransferase [Flavobacterium aestivum]|uniref:HsdM family class I SAM-dependent methyltransferase n=1 Tax=Flavobacterium aestivum TaxID=3003257 RepID=UPI0024826C3C|nr:N-6 DNA methylase [Flavobacterium aestivum]
MNTNSRNSLFHDLNLKEYERNLYSVNATFTENLLEYYRIQASIVNADYFYCFNNLTENQPIPFVYIYDQRENKQKKTIDLVEINRQLWTLGEIALAIIVYPDGFKIIDTRNPIKSESEPSFLDDLSDAIVKIDSILKKRIFEGLILEESPSDYVSVSPYQKLLNHIEIEILNKSKIIGCNQNLLKKLLVKFILIKYLEEQIDDSGNSVFENDFFDRFIVKNVVKTFFSQKNTFCDVLRGNNISGLLNFLNEKFNGGIFNISKDEEIELTNSNLSIIADALDGNKDLNGQMSIWRYYDFNLLPIEFISRLYERFVTSVDGKQKSTGAYYTPPHLARLLIDELLPFNKEIDFANFKILDPSCGSGIFLVLAYKRLITLWMLKNNKQSIEGEDDIKSIKKILSDCIYGVDINEDALSITATSLQIELTSHIRPKEIWENLTFDNLVEQANLTNLGFFKWYKSNFLKFDVIAGNPPFNISQNEKDENVLLGKDDDFSKEKFIDYNNKVQSFPDSNPALIFLHKSLEILLKPDTGSLFMIMPASTFLYTTKSFEYKKSLASLWNLERIYDFTPLREHLWGKTKIATIAVKITNNSSANSRVEHIIVRNSSANEKGSIRFQIDKYDKFYVPISFLFSKESIWKINLLGGGRLGLFVEKFNQYSSISNYFKNNNIIANIGFTRDKYVINDQKKRDTAQQVVNLNGLDILDSERFNCDKLTKEAVKKISQDDWVRVPKNGFAVPNVLVRLNINLNLPIIYNIRNLLIPNGVLTIKSHDIEKMKNFVTAFKHNRGLYIFLIKALSPKAFIQQGGGYSINRQDLLNLPINVGIDGDIIPFPSLDKHDEILIEDTELIAKSLNKTNGEIFKKIEKVDLIEYSNTFCEILNLTYEKDGYKFKPVRQVLTDDYVWVTFEHTNTENNIEQELNDESKIEFEKILFDDITNNSLTINKIIVYYGINNQISFIKSNKLKYWMRSTAYRDVENVKSEMFKSGY